MLKCKDIAHLSSEYLDDKLSTGQRLKVALHLLMCGKCREFVRQLKLSIAMMKQHRHEVLEEDAAKAIAQRAMADREGSS